LIFSNPHGSDVTIAIYDGAFEKINTF